MRYTLIMLLVLMAGTLAAQSKRKKKDEQQQGASTALEPSYPRQKTESKKSRKVPKGPTYMSQEEYYDRIAKLEKVKRKNEKLMEKPQYSDPSYFGHKRPPKKRKAGKIRYCRECGIRH